MALGSACSLGFLQADSLCSMRFQILQQQIDGRGGGIFLFEVSERERKVVSQEAGSAINSLFVDCWAQTADLFDSNLVLLCLFGYFQNSRMMLGLVMYLDGLESI